MNFKRHSDATLMGMTKAELVEYIRMCEHNREVAEQTLAQHFENVKDWQFVEPQFRKPLEILRKNFEKGMNSEYVCTPLSWALYQTWKVFDLGGVDDGKD